MKIRWMNRIRRIFDFTWRRAPTHRFLFFGPITIHRWLTIFPTKQKLRTNHIWSSKFKRFEMIPTVWISESNFSVSPLLVGFHRKSPITSILKLSLLSGRITLNSHKFIDCFNSESNRCKYSSKQSSISIKIYIEWLIYLHSVSVHLFFSSVSLHLFSFVVR